MTSFVNAFGSLEQEQNYSNNVGINLSNNIKNYQDPNHFSNIDLDQPATSLKENHSSYISLNDTETFQNDSLVISNAIPNGLSHNSSFSSHEQSPNKNFSSNAITNTSSVSTDQRLSLSDMSKISLSSAAAVAALGPKIDKFKQWSRTTYKCTKQSIYEKLGKTTRTVDIELDTQIELLRETKRQYENILALARSYVNHFTNLMQTQKGLNLQFLELKQKTPSLHDEFGYNAETQRLLVENGEILLNTLNYFISALNTLCSKTIEDTINTIRLYEISRLEYDACRSEMNLLSGGLQWNEKQNNLDKHKEKYEQLKCSVNVKLKLLEENQTKVMKTQLLLFHNAIAAYFSGNKEALDATIKQFNLKIDFKDDKKSFLE